MTILVKIFSSFSTSEYAKEIYEKIGETVLLDYYGEDKDIFFTTGENYTHAILMNTIMPNLTIPKENMIGLGHEPIYFLGLTQEFIEYAKKHIGKYYTGDTTLSDFPLPEPFVEKFMFMWHNTPQKSIPVKTNLMSIMVSHKGFAPGHKYRHQIVQSILNSNLPIDIYGNGCGYYSDIKDSRIKGTFELNEPYESYAFHIAIENYQSNHYFSEKIINPLLCNTTPIYLGCTNIHEYFPDVYIPMSGNAGLDMNLLLEICQFPDKYRRIPNIEKVKETIHLVKHLKDVWASPDSLSETQCVNA